MLQRPCRAIALQRSTKKAKSWVNVPSSGPNERRFQAFFRLPWPLFHAGASFSQAPGCVASLFNDIAMLWADLRVYL